MAHALFVKHPGKLAPADAQAEEILNGMKNGVSVLVSMKQPRNVRQHNLFFALCNKIFHSAETGLPSVESFRKALLIEAGHADKIYRLDGSYTWDAKSMAFDKMDQIKFQRLWDRCINIIYEKVIPHSPELEAEVNEMLTDRRFG